MSPPRGSRKHTLDWTSRSSFVDELIDLARPVACQKTPQCTWQPRGHDALAPLLPGIAIDRDSHYQLSNRIAFAWRLASLGVPTVLIYLGFTGDKGIADAGEPLANDEHWRTTFADHLAKVCPSRILKAPIEAGPARFWMLVRSRAALAQSPPPEPSAGRRGAAA